MAGSSPSGGTGVRSPRLIDKTGELARRDVIIELEETSQSFIVESREEERMFRPGPIMAVEVTERVWPRRVRTGEMRTPLEPGASSSAGRMVSEKSAPEERRTREEEKN